MQDNILEMRDITKSFFGVKVLKNAQLTVKKGQVHILLGENGAGAGHNPTLGPNQQRFEKTWF